MAEAMNNPAMRNMMQNMMGGGGYVSEGPLRALLLSQRSSDRVPVYCALRAR